MELNNYIVDRSTLRERIDKDRANDLLDKNASDPHYKITIDSLGSANRYIIMECPKLPQYKGDKKKGMSITYVDPLKPEKSFTATNCQFDVQGTSSQGYPIRNFKIKMKQDDAKAGTDGCTWEYTGGPAKGKNILKLCL